VKKVGLLSRAQHFKGPCKVLERAISPSSRLKLSFAAVLQSGHLNMTLGPGDPVLDRHVIKVQS